MNDESVLHKELRRASYPALNWAARKAADNAERLINERIEERVNQAIDYVQDISDWLSISVLWELERRLGKHPDAGIDSILAALADERGAREKPLILADFVQEFMQALVTGEVRANRLYSDFRYGVTWAEEQSCLSKEEQDAREAYFRPKDKSK